MTAAALAAALGGRVVDHHGDARIIVGADLIYASFNGSVRLDHRGHITTLGRFSDGADALADAYRARLAAVAAPAAEGVS